MSTNNTTAIRTITAVLGSIQSNKMGTIGGLIKDIRDLIRDAKMQNLSDEEIADLPIVYWNRSNHRANCSLNLYDRRKSIGGRTQPILDKDGKELAKLPTDLYAELFDKFLPLVKVDGGEA